jgi:hypothetical protein
MQLLPWAEMHGDTAITTAEVNWIAQTNSLGCRSDPAIISAHIWSYLNKCLKVNAETLFEKVEVRNGLEAWRMIYRWIGYGTEDRVEELRRKLRQPPVLKDLSMLDVVLATWEKDIKEFEDAGGERKSEGELKGILQEILPLEFKKHLVWTNDKFATYLEFKQHVRSQVQVYLRYTGGAKTGMHLVDGDGAAKSEGQRARGPLPRHGRRCPREDGHRQGNTCHGPQSVRSKKRPTPWCSREGITTRTASSRSQRHPLRQLR